MIKICHFDIESRVKNALSARFLLFFSTEQTICPEQYINNTKNKIPPFQNALCIRSGGIIILISLPKL